MTNGYFYEIMAVSVSVAVGQPVNRLEIVAKLEPTGIHYSNALA